MAASRALTDEVLLELGSARVTPLKVVRALKDPFCDDGEMEVETDD